MAKNTAKKIVGAAALGAGVWAAFSYAAFYEVAGRGGKLHKALEGVFNKADDGAVQISPEDTDERAEWLDRQELENFEMISDDCKRLKGFLLKADKPSDVYIFCSHGYRSSGKNQFRFIIKYYHDKGYNVFFVDHQAAGESDGNYIGMGYYEHRDCMKWLEFMNETFGSDIRIVLHGISMGSATVMMMAGDENLPENVVFAIADCGYTSAWAEFEHNLKNIHFPVHPLLDTARIMGKRVAGYDYKQISPIDSVQKVKIPMLFVHGSKDNFVPVHMATELYEACSSEDKDLLIIEGAPHAESYRVDSKAYEEKTDKFFAKYID